MSDAVPARVALAYLATLSADLTGAVVLGAGGRVQAGDEELGPLVLRLLEGAGPGTARRRPHAGGTLFAARSATHLLGLVVGPHALEAVVVHDLLATVDDLRDW